MNAEAPLSTRTRSAEFLRRWRRALMLSLPILLLVVGAAFWLTGADMSRPTTPMSGRTV
jgi:hypothetical protein